MAQKFMTYEQQLNKLRNDKALTIPNLDDAKKVLEEISYYMAHLYEIIENDELYQFYREKGMKLEFEQSVREN